MDMEHFTLTVTGITKEEYQQACQINNRRAYVILAAAMVVICGIIILATGNASPAAILGPVAIFVICVVAMELLTRLNYKGQLENVDPVVYEFGPLGWRVTSNGQAVEVDWRATPKLKKSKDCLFVYNTEASSNLLPRRLLLPEQEAQLSRWFQDSRLIAKEYEKKQLRKEREEFKKNHPGLRLGRTGPAWGPWRRKK